jgi:uncharacterized protein involved in exopolysaccharide biosynthesis
VTKIPIPSPPLPSSDDGDLFGPLGDWGMFLVRAPRRHRRLAAAVLGGCLLLGLVAFLAFPRKYRVETTVLAQRNALMGTLSNPGMNRDWDTPARAAREIVIRRSNLVNLARQTSFASRYIATRAPAVRIRDWILGTIFRRERTEAQLEDDLVNSLEQRLVVWVTPEGAVTLQFTWSDPDIAFDIADAALQSFLEARNAAETGAVGEAIAILQGHDTRVQQDIAEAIRKLDAKEQSLRIRSGPRRVGRSAAAPKMDEELQRLQGLLAARRRALADLDDFRHRRVSELQLQLSQQLATLGPEHPNVLSTRRAIAALSTPSPQAADLKAEIAQFEKSIAARPGATAAAPHASGMEDELAAARAALLEQNDPRLEYERRQLESLLRRHAGLLERIESARIELDTARSAFAQRYTIVAPPKRPRGPIGNLALLYLGGALFAGLLLACAVAAAADLWSGRIHEPWQLERALGLPLLGSPRH